MSEKEPSRSCRGMILALAVGIIPFTSWSPAPWLMGVFSLLVATVFLGDSKASFTSRSFPVVWSPTWIPLFLLFALSLYHMAGSPVPYRSLLFLAQLTVSLVFYHLLLTRAARVSTLTIVMIWVGVLVPWTLAERFFAGVRAPGGPFFNPNYLATVILSCLAYLAGSLIDTREDRKAIPVLAGGALLCTMGLLLIGSRSGALGILLIWAIVLTRSAGMKRWIAAAVIAFVIIAPSTVRHRVTQEYKEDPHAFSRLDIWQAALKMGADYPLAGVGPNLFYEHSPVYAFPTDDLPVRYGRIVRKPHNEYLRSWAEGGMVGVAAAGLFVFLTLRLMVLAWREGRAGPSLAMGAVLFQALFHDITKAFALMVLAVWWLSHLAPDGVRKIEVGKGKSVILTVTIALLIAGSSLWLSLDVVSRVMWYEGQQRMNTDVRGAEESLFGALHLNPLLPGPARDLAQVRLNQVRKTGALPDFEKAEKSILRAWKLDRLDTVPLRLQAALYVELATRNGGDLQRQTLMSALDMLHRAAALEPHNALILVSMADVFWDLGQRPQALRLIEQALIKEPNYLAAHRTRISYLSVMDPASVPEATLSMEKAVERAAGYEPHSTYEEIILR